ncbi:MAG TPA: hypothetical protein ENI95_09860 [Chloroflexi bacterium]|nr:hypothetical protein [Chloroflexota bacterium]
MPFKRANPFVVGLILIGLGVLPFLLSLVINGLFFSVGPAGPAPRGVFLRQVLVDYSPVCSALLCSGGLTVLGLAALRRRKTE